MEGSLTNYIRTHRKRAGLTQRELGKIIGYTKAAVYHHEHVTALPNLLTALRYEVLFLTPVSELFAGMREAIVDEIDQRLEELEGHLEREEGHGRSKQTLDWLSARRQSLDRMH